MQLHQRAPPTPELHSPLNPSANPQTALCVCNGKQTGPTPIVHKWACRMEKKPSSGPGWAACGSGGVERSSSSWTTHQPCQRVVDAPKVHRRGRNPECCGVAGADEVSKVKAERQAAKAEGLRLALGGTTGCGGARAGEPTERERQNTAQKCAGHGTGMRVRAAQTCKQRARKIDESESMNAYTAPCNDQQPKPDGGCSRLGCSRLGGGRARRVIWPSSRFIR